MGNQPPTPDLTWVDANPSDVLPGDLGRETIRGADAQTDQSATVMAAAAPLVLGALRGRGGFANVYEAHQETLDRKVAVKCLHKRDGRRSAALFVCEAKFTARLNHPNILPVHDLVELDGAPALVMKLVDGRSWAAHLEAAHGDGSVELADEVTRLRDVARATAFAHSRGVLHLDLKPANVMVGDFGETLVMDWGCAVFRSEADRGPDTALPVAAQVTSVRGTPVYMAPELARAEGAALGPATDVYLLGAILHELLTHTPLRQAGSTHEVLTVAKAADRPALSPSLDPVLRRLCAAALDPDPQTRLDSAAEFAARLQHWLDTRESRAQTRRGLARLGELSTLGALDSEQQREAVGLLGVFEQAGRGGAGLEVAVRAERKTRRLLAAEALRRKEPGLARQFSLPLPEDDQFRARTLARAERLARTQRWGRWSLRGLGVVVVLGLVGAVGGWNALSSYEDLVSAQRQRVEGQQAFSRILLNALGSAEDLGLDPELILRVLAEAEDGVREQYADEPLVQAELWASMGRAYKRLEKDAEAERYLRRAMQQQQQIRGLAAPETLHAMEALANLYQHLHRTDDALRLRAAVLSRAVETHGADSEEAIAARTRMANVHQREGRHEEALSLLLENVALREEALGPKHPDTLSMVADLAWMLTQSDRLEQAGPHAQRAYEAHKQVLGPTHPDTQGSAHVYALWLSRVGRNAEAAALLRGVVAFREATEGFENVQTLHVAQNLALELRSLGEYTDAHALLARIAPQMERLEGPRGYSTQIARSNLGQVLQELGRAAEAEPLLRSAHTVRLEELGERDPKTLISAYFLGLLLVELGEVESAAELLEGVDRLAPQVFGREHANTLEMRSAWAVALAAQGRSTEAVALAQSLAAAANETRGPLDEVTRSCLEFLAEVHRHGGDEAAAERVLDQLIEARRKTLGDGHPKTLRSVARRVAALSRLGQAAEAKALGQRWTQAVLDGRALHDLRPEQQGWLKKMAAPHR